MRNNILISILMMLYINASGQEAENRKNRMPVWLYTAENCDIYGISLGIGSDNNTNAAKVRTRTYGLRFEPLSEALLALVPFFETPSYKIPDNEEDYEIFKDNIPNEVVYGMNISAGTNSFIDVNGVTLSGIAQDIKTNNGISIAGLFNGSFVNNGIQLGGGASGAVYSNGIIAGTVICAVYKGNGIMLGMDNEYVKFKGLQIGFLNDMENKSESFNGVQIGAFNRTKKLRGIQIGLININSKRTLPFINWDFSKK